MTKKLSDKIDRNVIFENSFICENNFNSLFLF